MVVSFLFKISRVGCAVDHIGHRALVLLDPPSFSCVPMKRHRLMNAAAGMVFAQINALAIENIYVSVEAT